MVNSFSPPHLFNYSFNKQQLCTPEAMVLVLMELRG